MLSADTSIGAGLASRGFAVVPDFYPAAGIAELVRVVHLRDGRGEFRPAATGAGTARAVRPHIRGDRIHWLAGDGDPAELRLLAHLEALRVELNASCTLGLVDLECHYAIYPPGAGYVRHLDRSPAGVERVVSVVLYLNEGWTGDDGGELRLHTTPVVDVEPLAGTLVAFLSEEIEHEVRAARRERLSLTGWFRRRGRLAGGDLL